jgi:hypothetical protein
MAAAKLLTGSFMDESYPASGHAVVGHVPEDLEPLHRGVAPARRGVIEARLEQPVLGLQPAVLIPQSGHRAQLSAHGSALAPPEQSLLTGRLGTQRDGSNQQGNSPWKDLHADTLLERERPPEAPPERLIW